MAAEKMGEIRRECIGVVVAMGWVWVKRIPESDCAQHRPGCPGIAQAVRQATLPSLHAA